MADQYSYSWDQEHFNGRYDTPEEALEAGQNAHPGCTIYVGKISPFVPDYTHAATIVLESLAQQAHDTCGEVAEIWGIDDHSDSDLISAVAHALQSIIEKTNPPDSFWTVTDVTEHEYSEDKAEVEVVEDKSEPEITQTVIEDAIAYFTPDPRNTNAIMLDANKCRDNIAILCSAIRAASASAGCYATRTDKELD